MATKDIDQDALGSLFAAARRDAARPVEEKLLARVLADAKTPLPTQTFTPRRGFRAALDAIGGWPAFGGLATAAMTGVWLGLVPPAPLEDLAVDIGWGGLDTASLILPDYNLADLGEDL